MITLTIINKQIAFGVDNKPISLTIANRNINYNLNTSNVILKSVINAKGDLIVGDEVAEPARLPIGQPNYFMVVDPSQDRGYKFTNEIDGGTF